MQKRSRKTTIPILCSLFLVGLVWMISIDGYRETQRVFAQTDELLYLPVIYNGHGDIPDPTTFQLALVDDAGAWLMSLDGTHKTILTTDVQFGDEDDFMVVRAAPDGSRIAVQQTEGWGIYERNGRSVTTIQRDGFALTWDWKDNTTTDPMNSLLLSKKGHGIDHVASLLEQPTALITTSDDTSDHSPLWNAAGSQLIFAHHEFGGFLYVMIIANFDSNQVPYLGENRDANKLNDAMILLENVDSWHDQPITFHWTASEDAVVFAAKQTIYVVDLATKDAVTIDPLGFGERASGRAVDLVNDQILYFANDGIYVVGLDGQNPRRVVEGTDLHYPQWTESGEEIVYRGTDDQLYIVRADGSNNRLIPNTNGVKQFDLLK